MQLTVIFEEWHIGDGNYPPLRRGMDVNLSFQIEPSAPLEEISSAAPLSFRHAGNGEYHFVAEVIRNYPPGDSPPIAVFNTGEFRFYIEAGGVGHVPVGTRVRGTGTLLLDYYIWVEFPEDYPDPPDLFYNLQVVRITKVRIPERFVTRHARGKSYPLRVSPAELRSGDYEELETMEGEALDEAFWMVDFESARVTSIPKTFRSR